MLNTVDELVVGFSCYLDEVETVFQLGIKRFYAADAPFLAFMSRCEIRTILARRTWSRRFVYSVVSFKYWLPRLECACNP